MTAALIPWPTAEQLERMGFKRCATQPCNCWIDPVNVPAGRCRDHHLQHTRTQRKDRSLADVRFAPRPHRARTPKTLEAH